MREREREKEVRVRLVHLVIGIYYSLQVLLLFSFLTSSLIIYFVSRYLVGCDNTGLAKVVRYIKTFLFFTVPIAPLNLGKTSH